MDIVWAWSAVTIINVSWPGNIGRKTRHQKNIQANTVLLFYEDDLVTFKLRDKTNLVLGVQRIVATTYSDT